MAAAEQRKIEQVVYFHHFRLYYRMLKENDCLVQLIINVLGAS